MRNSDKNERNVNRKLGRSGFEHARRPEIRFRLIGLNVPRNAPSVCSTGSR